MPEWLLEAVYETVSNDPIVELSWETEHCQCLDLQVPRVMVIDGEQELNDHHSAFTINKLVLNCFG